jgi:hypothetical protein
LARAAHRDGTELGRQVGAVAREHEARAAAFIGARARRGRGARAKESGGVPGLDAGPAAWLLALTGSSGPPLGRNGWVRAGRAHGLGPNRKDRLGFLFSEIILNAKTIPENLEIILKA